ncbi:hypothetical protein OR571_03395 [Psychrobacillus sp. NEAU-3TGS]|uniref:hypothetical protein n=1 Tax=Psychrobacillus sp. NEAU-3TGS TaxID=2995412 RepID=UPI0024975EC3|nr:hypothetical protein [Psychrobacillus sp. NEAU-3TGS]MDI2586194.1 hypothetical protein [Psychrobacillus sp. NEAU-3TGS]
MKSFESYSFTRLLYNESLEFFFILGVNDSDDFSIYVDQRLIEVLGYLVIYKNLELDRNVNLIYLVENDTRDDQKTIRYAQQFAMDMTNQAVFGQEDFIVRKTNINPRIVSQPYIDFVKKIIGDDIPQSYIGEE